MNRFGTRLQQKTWFAIEGNLEPIDFLGPSNFRYPKELALRIIEEFCPPGGSVFDPFVGFGTTIEAAEQLGRWGMGFEFNALRAQFAQSRIRAPSRIINDKIQNLRAHSLPKFDLIFTSPPYGSFDSEENDPKQKYIADLESNFGLLKDLMHQGSKLVIEISNVKDDRETLPIAFLATAALLNEFNFLGELVRCNTSNAEAGPGYDHSFILIFALK